MAGDLLRVTNNELPITIWRDYALPSEAPPANWRAGLAKEGAADTLIITCSYSGNTEETVSSFLEASKRRLPLAVITTGGKLLEFAHQHQTPYIQLPDTGIQPRMATGYMIKALAAVTGLKQTSKELFQLSTLLDADAAEAKGENLARCLRGKLPIIYASNKNLPIAYTWKIKFNETAKVPAFFNVFPELNHNEMTGFDNCTKEGVTHSLHFIFLEDPNDDPRILKRMRVTKQLLKTRGFPTSHILLPTSNLWHKIFQTLLVADFAAYYLAKHYGHDPEQVPMVEEFKKSIV